MREGVARLSDALCGEQEVSQFVWSAAAFGDVDLRTCIHHDAPLALRLAEEGKLQPPK